MSGFIRSVTLDREGVDGERYPFSIPALRRLKTLALDEYILDEPEAALSLRGQLALMRRMHELVGDESQFIVSTHSPVLLRHPNALIYALTESGIERTPYEETEQYELTRSFLDDRDRFLRHLFADDD